MARRQKAIDSGIRAREAAPIIYHASKTCSEFHRSNKFVRALLGPIGSGKSVACIMELVKRAFEQAPNRMGIRKSRWVIVRNTYRELIDTTINTFFDWVPEASGEFVKLDMIFYLSSALPDGTMVHTEFLFRALDRPNDVKKLLSLEVTGGFINECREIPKAVVDMLQGRCGRYPSKKDGGPTWHGVIMDTNPPDSDSWFYKLFEEDMPSNHAIWRQPSGVSPEAENIENLPPNYYTNMMAGKDKEWVNVYVHGRYGYIVDGKPVYPEYKDHIHFGESQYIPNPKLPIYVGIDFGLTPAASIAQQKSSGQLVVFDELATFDMGAVSFSKLLKEKLDSYNKYGKFRFEIYGDPAGDFRAQTDEQTVFDILLNNGISAYPTHTNDPIIRREVVANLMQRLDFDGNPAFLLTPGCPLLRKACAGGFKYKRVQVSGDARYMDVPDKNRYSHIGESIQYLVLGALGDTSVIGGMNSGKLDYSQTNRTIR